jgi:hypothetical protein
LTITVTKTPRPKVPHETLMFGHVFSDHMLEVEWTKQHGYVFAFSLVLGSMSPELGGWI